MYRISLPNQRVISHKIINFFVALLNVMAFGFALSNTNETNTMLGLGFAISIVGLILYLVKMFSRFLQSFIIQILFLICAIIWLIHGEITPGVLLLLCALLGLISTKKHVIVFDESAITLPTFPEKEIQWAEVDFVKLKDGILSIELKNNHLIQHTLNAATIEEINEDDFNAFCENNAKR